MQISDARLERWMREYYFDTEIDIGSSGVTSYSLSEIRELAGITHTEIDGVIFDDSRTLGAPELRRAISKRWADGNPERVFATHGSSEGIFLIMQSIADAGDEVLVLDPCYQQLYEIAESIGCRLKRWPLRAQQGFAPDVEEGASLITDCTRVIVVNFPHNPTGVSLTAAEQQYLIDAAARTGAYLVWDSAFAELTYDAAPLPDPAVMYDRAISLGTLSKAFGLPGLRVGWCLAPSDVLQRCVHLRDYTTLHLSPLIELIARKVIENADAVMAPRLRMAKKNRQILASWVEEHSEDVGWRLPQGGVCGFLQMRNCKDVDRLCRELAHRHKVLLVPGSCFKQPDHVRLGFGGPTEEMEEGLFRLSGLLAASRNAAGVRASWRRRHDRARLMQDDQPLLADQQG